MYSMLNYQPGETTPPRTTAIRPSVTTAITPTIQTRPATPPRAQLPAGGQIQMTDAGGQRPRSFPGFTDLRGTTIRPSTGGATSQTQNMTTTLASRLMGGGLPGFQGVAPANYGAARGYLGQAAGQAGQMQIGQQYGSVAPGSYTPGGDTSQVRDMVLRALGNANGVDRSQLALNTFDLLQRQTEPQYQQELRQVGQRNAALGRLGAGMVTNELMDVTAQRQRDLAQAREQLANDAAGQTLADRLAQLNAASGVFGQFGGEDRANAGMQLDLRNEARGERQFNVDTDALRAQLAGQRAGLYSNLAGQEGDFATQGYSQRANERDARDQYALAGRGQDLSLLGQLGGLNQQFFGQDMTRDNALRSERDFQSSQAQQAIANALQQRMSEDALQNSAYNRYFQALQGYGGLGYGGLPSGTMMDAANQYGQQGAAGIQGLGDLTSEYGYLDWLKRNGGVLQ